MSSISFDPRRWVVIGPRQLGHAVMPPTPMCQLLAIVGKRMSFVLLDENRGVQLLNPAGRRFASPIPPAAAGLQRLPDGPYRYPAPAPDPAIPAAPQTGGTPRTCEQRKQEALRVLRSLAFGDRAALTMGGCTYPVRTSGAATATQDGPGADLSTGVVCNTGEYDWSARIDVRALLDGNIGLAKTGSAKTITIQSTYTPPEHLRATVLAPSATGASIYDCYDWDPLIDTVIRFLHAEQVTAPSSPGWHPGVRYSHPEQSYVDRRTGYHCRPVAELAGFTDAESRTIFARLSGATTTGEAR